MIRRHAITEAEYGDIRRRDTTRLDPSRDGAADIIARKHADKAVSDMRRADRRQPTVWPCGDAPGEVTYFRADRIVARWVAWVAAVIAVGAVVVVVASHWQ